MASGIWTAVSGAKSQADAVDAVANNLANSNTIGFKKDQPTFKEYLSILERDSGYPDIPRGPIKDKEFYPLDGRDQSFVVTDGTYTNFRQGHHRVTNLPLDMALVGPGFFEVSTPEGVRYTRHGSFKLATDGQLVTSEGYPVLSSQPGGLASALPATVVQPSQGGPLTQGGVAAERPQPQPEIVARYINLGQAGPSSRVSVSESGEIFIGNNSVGQLSVVEFVDLRNLRKQGGLLFQNQAPENLKTDPPLTQVRQGMVETSNVNPVEEMTNLIKAHRNFDQNLKAIRTYDSLMSKEVSEVGKL